MLAKDVGGKQFDKIGAKLLLLEVTLPSININMEDGIKAKTTNPPVANTETEIQIDRFV